MNEKILEFAEKGVFISAAFDKNCNYYHIPSWVYIVSTSDDFKTYYGYDSYEQAINEALPIAKTMSEND